MGEILSQDEIDELLKAMNSGDGGNIVISAPLSSKGVKDYNFARPSKFNKEQLHTLEIIFDNYSRIVSSFMTGYMRTSCIIEVANAEQMTYSEFSNSLVNPVVLGMIDFSPLKGTVVLELSANLGYSIIDRILGGPGVSMKKLREFSEIEEILLERVMSQMLIYLTEPWESVVKLKPRLEKIETNSQFAQIISPNEMIALVTLTAKIGGSEGMINFCIPHLVIEPIMGKLYTKFWFESNFNSGDDDGYKEDIENQLEQTNVPISAVIGKTNLLVDDFINLQVGDVIPLDSYITSDINIMVGNILKFYGKPGLSRNKNAIQITSVVDKEE